MCTAVASWRHRDASCVCTVQNRQRGVAARGAGAARGARRRGGGGRARAPRHAAQRRRAGERARAAASRRARARAAGARPAALSSRCVPRGEPGSGDARRVLGAHVCFAPAEQRRQQLREVEAPGADPLAVYGGAMAELCRRVRAAAERGHFSAPPRGPVGECAVDRRFTGCRR